MRLLVTSFILMVSASLSATEFYPCKDANDFNELNGTQCAIVKAPLDYEADDSEYVDLFVRKFPALENKSGALWMFAGGPGESGASFYSTIERFRKLFKNHDIYIPDHRGTGASSRICPGELSTSTAGSQLVGKEWGECFGHMYQNIQFVNAFNITNAAKDLQYLIQKYGSKGEVVVYGVSYGTQLVLRMLQLDGVQPDIVLLDSLVPFQTDDDYDLSKRSIVVDSIGRELLNRCKENNCVDGSESLTEKLQELYKERRTLKDFAADLPELPLSDFLGTLLDVPTERNKIPHIITELSQGKSKLLKESFEKANLFYQKFNPGYENFGSSIPLVQIITASENNLRVTMTKLQVAEESKSLLFSSPLPALMAENSMPTYAKDNYYAKVP